MLRRAAVVAAVSLATILAGPLAAQAAQPTEGGWRGGGTHSRGTSGGGGTHDGAGRRGTSSTAPAAGSDYVEVRWATPLSSDATRPRDGEDAALWPQRLATATTCGVWLQYDRYVPGPTTDRLVSGGVLYGPNNPAESLATRHPYPETGQPWTFVKAPDCGTTAPTTAPTPAPTRSTTPCPSTSPTPRPSGTPSAPPTPAAPQVPSSSPTPSHSAVPSSSPTPDATPAVTTSTTPTASPSGSPSATPSPTAPDTEVLASGPTPPAEGGIVRSTPPPAYQVQSPVTPDDEVLASTGSSGAGVVGIVAAVLAGAGALLVVARRRSAR